MAERGGTEREARDRAYAERYGERPVYRGVWNEAWAEGAREERARIVAADGLLGEIDAALLGLWKNVERLRRDVRYDHTKGAYVEFADEYAAFVGVLCERVTDARAALGVVSEGFVEQCREQYHARESRAAADHIERGHPRTGD